MRNCPDCVAKPGDLHEIGCDVERCPDCGGQYISCHCKEWDTPTPRLPWTGEWPGVAECREFGWYSIRNPSGPGYVPVPAGTPGATEDLNRLCSGEARWDREKGRWVLR